MFLECIFEKILNCLCCLFFLMVLCLIVYAYVKIYILDKI